MRERSIVTIVDVWYDILVRYHQTNPDIVNLCLSVVKVYVGAFCSCSVTIVLKK